MRLGLVVRLTSLVPWVLVAFCVCARAVAAVSIDIGTETAAPGSSVAIGVRVRTMDADVAAVQNRIDFAPPLRVAALPNGEPDCTVSPAIGKNATGFRFLPLRCAGAACTGVRAVVLSFENVDPLPDNSVLYTCRVAVAANAAEGDYSLRNSDLGASDARGGFVTAQGNDGAVRVRRSSLAIDIDDAETAPGEDVVIGVRLRQMGAAAVGAQNRIDFAAPLRIAARVDGAPDCTVNAAIDKRATTFRFLPIGCVGSGCTGTRAVVLAFDNLAVIPDAAVLYTCHVEVEADAAPGSYVLRNAEANGSDAAGAFLPASAGDGTVTIFQDDALVAIDIGSVRAISGQRASVDVRLRSLGPDAPAVAGTQNEIVFDPATPIAATEDGRPACAVNPDLGRTSILWGRRRASCRPGVRALPSRMKGPWVFPSRSGETPMDAQNFYNRVFLPALAEAGIEGVTWHTLRHTEAAEHPGSIRRSLGVPLRSPESLSGLLRA